MKQKHKAKNKERKISWRQWGERTWASLLGSVMKNPLANSRDVGDPSSTPGLGRYSGGGHGNPLQYTCLENQSHGQKSLVDNSPQCRKESDTTQHNLAEATQHSTHACERTQGSPSPQMQQQQQIQLQMKEFWRLAEGILYNQDNHLKEVGKEEQTNSRINRRKQ